MLRIKDFVLGTFANPDLILARKQFVRSLLL